MTAKKPADRQTKKPTVRTVDGGREVTFHNLVEKDRAGNAILDAEEKPTKLKVLVADQSLDDWELLEELGKLDGNPTMLPSVLNRLVGDQYMSVLNAIRNESGRVTITDGDKFIQQLLGAFNPS